MSDEEQVKFVNETSQEQEDIAQGSTSLPEERDESSHQLIASSTLSRGGKRVAGWTDEGGGRWKRRTAVELTEEERALQDTTGSTGCSSRRTYFAGRH